MSGGYQLEPAHVEPHDLVWEERQEQLQLEALDRVRAVAEKWTASIGALFGLFGALLIVRGRTDIAQLSSDYELLVAIVLGLGILSAAVAVGFAAFAAQGTPSNVQWPGGPDLRTWTHTEAVKAKGRLFWSRVATAAAMLLVLGAIGLTWFGETDAAGPNVVVVSPAGAVLCGELVRAGGTLSVRPSGGEAVAVGKEASAASVTVVPKCP
jgi:hypothetical protein